MCAVRVEADDGELPGTEPYDLAVADGHVFVAVADSDARPQAYRVVTFKSGMTVRVLDEHPGELIATDGTTVYVLMSVGPQGLVKRFDANGTARPDLVFPADDYRGSYRLAAENGVLFFHNIGDLLTRVEDGVSVSYRNVTAGQWFTVFKGEAFLAGADRLLLRSGAGTTMRAAGRFEGEVAGLAVDEGSISAITASSSVGEEWLAVERFVRTTAAEATTAPDAKYMLDSSALEAINAATHRRSGELAPSATLGVVTAGGRLYFGMDITRDSSPADRVLATWSVDRGFRPFAKVATRPNLNPPLVVRASKGRLYWIEPSSDTDTHWRVVSAPL